MISGNYGYCGNMHILSMILLLELRAEKHLEV